MSTIAEKIKDLRLERGLTQPQLAKEIGVSNGTISFWENGLNIPRADYIKKLAAVLNTTTEFLLETEDNQNQNTHKTKQHNDYTEDEQALIATYRTLSAGKKKALFDMLDISIETQGKKKA